MKIVSLLENTSTHGLSTEHGLSLYIETQASQRLLFDMGQSNLFAENAQHLGIKLDTVQLAILSHGHYDHGGGLEKFLEINDKAPVYIHTQAFEPHFSLRDTGLRYIGLNEKLKGHPQLVFCNEKKQLANNLLLFSGVTGQQLCPPGNQLLYGPTPEQHDTFAHEQNLLIEEGDKLILIAGCAHGGIINIIHEAEKLTNRPLTHVIAGMHLAKHGLSATDETIFIKTLSEQLLSRTQCQYYTMHCTGEDAYQKLKTYMQDHIHYLSCGDTLYL